jgi:hypothetical protein
MISGLHILIAGMMQRTVEFAKQMGQDDMILPFDLCQEVNSDMTFYLVRAEISLSTIVLSVISFFRSTN